jgi:glycosyltransferase involved in cell wall biosynthesis
MRRPEKVIVVHNAVDATEFSPDGPVEDTGDVRQGTLKVGLPAALTQIKGHELLLRAAMRIQKEIPSVNFYFIGGTIYDTVGDRGYEDKLRRSVKEKGLEPSVVFTGFQEKMAPWYRAMDIVVNASTVPEGFGRTLLEAMACGKAVAGPNAGGIPEFVRHGENGLLYEMGNADALADTILTLLHDPALRQRLASSGRETAIHRFTTEPYAKAISQVLHDAAGNSASTFLRLPHSPDYALKNVRSAQ